MISLIFEIKNIPTNNNNNNNKNWIQDTENRFLIAKDRAWGMEEMGEGVKKNNKNFILDIRYKQKKLQHTTYPIVEKINKTLK